MTERGNDHRHARGWKGRARQEGLRAEIAADVAAFLAAGGTVLRIPDGVSGLDEQGMPRTARRVGGGRGRDLTVVTTGNIGARISAADARRRMEHARTRPRKPPLAAETVAAVLQAAQRMAVPVRAQARKYNRGAERTARRRIAAEALAQIGAPYGQIAEALDVRDSTVANWRRETSEAEALCARDLVRECSP